MNKKVKKVKLDDDRRDWNGISRPATKPHSTKKGKKGYSRKNRKKIIDIEDNEKED